MGLVVSRHLGTILLGGGGGAGVGAAGACNAGTLANRDLLLSVSLPSLTPRRARPAAPPPAAQPPPSLWMADRGAAAAESVVVVDPGSHSLKAGYGASFPSASDGPSVVSWWWWG